MKILYESILEKELEPSWKRSWDHGNMGSEAEKVKSMCNPIKNTASYLAGNYSKSAVGMGTENEKNVSRLRPIFFFWGLYMVSSTVLKSGRR